MATTGIYGLKNRISGKFYVGQSIDIERRWRRHKANASARRDKTALLDAIRSYGPDAFELIVLEECSVDALNDRESHWIEALDAMRNGYNHLSGGGQGPREMTPETRERFRLAQLGKKHTDEHKAKIGAAAKGREVSAETRAKRRANGLGRIFSPEWRQHISDAKKNPPAETLARMAIAQLGKTHSVESRQKMSAMRKGVKKSPEHRAKIAAALQGNNNRKKN